MQLEYKQPSFYHFNEDSLLLAKFGARYLRKDKQVLDMCAGCGVVGIELLKNAQINTRIDFLELQSGFINCLKENVKQLGNCDPRVFKGALGQFEPDLTYDFIISNPPYFVEGEGRPSPNRERQVSRTFEVDTIEIFLRKCISLMSHNSLCLFCYPLESVAWKKHLESIDMKLETYPLAKHLNVAILTKGDIDK